MQTGLTTRQIAATVAMATAVQGFTALSLSIASVLAPVIGPEIGIPAQFVGNLVAIQFFAGIVSGLLCTALMSRWGPIGILRLAVVLAVAGIATAASGHVALLLLFAALCGLGHGLVNPPSSQVLMRAAPARMRSLIFSIKQTGVPLGMAAAGALLPALLLVMRWQHALLAIAAVALGLVFVLAPFRGLYDSDRRPSERISVRCLSEPIAAALRKPPLRRFILSAGVYSFIQPCVTSYVVTYLSLDLGYSLVAAGLVFAALNIASVVGRVAWGALADWSGSPRRVLAALGVVMGLCCIAAAAFTPQWSPVAVVAVCIVWGLSAVGWNGVYLAEVARLAPEGEVSLATSGSQVYLFSGAVIGPPLFGLLASVIGFSFAYIVLAVPSIAAGLFLLRGAVERKPLLCRI